MVFLRPLFFYTEWVGGMNATSLHTEEPRKPQDISLKAVRHTQGMPRGLASPRWRRDHGEKEHGSPSLSLLRSIKQHGCPGLKGECGSLGPGERSWRKGYVPKTACQVKSWVKEKRALLPTRGKTAPSVCILRTRGSACSCSLTAAPPHPHPSQIGIVI